MQTSQRPLNVFLADDSVLIREKLRSLFSVLPAVKICGEADNAKQAIEDIRDKDTDVVVLDIDLRESSGLEVLKAIKSVTPSPLVIVLSIHSFEDMGEFYLQAGADYYFEKGGEFDTILSLLEDEGMKSTRQRDWKPSPPESSGITAHPNSQSGIVPAREHGASDIEQAVRITMERSPDCVGILNHDKCLIWMNSSGRQLMQLELAQLAKGIGWLELWSAESHDSATTAYATVQTDNHGRFIGIRRRAGGGEQHWDVTLTPIPNDTNDSPHCLFIARDISDHRASEEILLRSEARYRSLFDSSIDGIFQTAADGSVLVANTALANILGYSTSNELLIDWPHFPRESFAQTSQRAEFFDRILSTEGLVRGFEYEIRLKDGSTIWVSVSARSTRDEEGHFLGYKASMEDITTRRRSEKLIREQADFLNRAHNAITVTDLTGRVTFWNQGAERIFGYSASEALGKIPTEMLPEPENIHLLKISRQVMKVGEWRGEISVPNKTGKQIQVDAHITLICDENGAPKARLCIASDVTEKRQLEDHVIQGQRLEGIGMLAAGIAHDLNNALAPILMAVPMLTQHTDSPFQHKLLEMMGKSAERGTGLVRQILSFANQSESKATPLELPSLITELSNLIQETFPKTIDYEVELEPALWMVKGNAVQLHQVLLNLCVNARDAMENEGTIKLTAANRQLNEAEAGLIRGGIAGAYVCLSITDSGPGIPPEILGQIWDPFFSTKAPDKGTGLGLSTVRGIVEKHRGFMVLNSTPQVGCTFEVWLPAFSQIMQNEVPPVLFDTTPDGSDLILIVDDEPTIRDYVRSALTKHGYRVHAACDGAEAVDFFTHNSQSVSLVITDLLMPNLDGKALVQSIRKLAPDTKFIIMSGNISETESYQINAQNKVGFIHKPFSIDTLITEVGDMLSPSISEA